MLHLSHARGPETGPPSSADSAHEAYEAEDVAVNALDGGGGSSSRRPVQGPPTHANVPYGPHQRNVLDFWQAEGEGARPVLVWIHGGGWRRGSKDEVSRNLEVYFDKGISVAVISYRLVPEHPLPAPVDDAVRAIQFLRSKSEEWKIDKKRIAGVGTSAGGCSVLYMLFREDLADPDSPDPIRRESSRLAAGVSEEGQSSIDPQFIEPLLGSQGISHPMIFQSVGESTIGDALANYQKHAGLYREYSPINHVSAGDPPVFLSYARSAELPATDAGHGIHHPLFGIKLKEACDAAGVECHLVADGVEEPSEGINAIQFLLRSLGCDESPNAKIDNVSTQ